MIKKLRVRLTHLFAILTSVIFWSALIITWTLTSNRYHNDMMDRFGKDVASVTNCISSVAILKDSWLVEQEYTKSCIIYIEDNSSPLHYEGAELFPTGRTQLIQFAKDFMPSPINRKEPQQNTTYMIRDYNNQPYMCSYSDIVQGSERHISVWMITDYNVVLEQTKTNAIVYLLLAFFGCLMLTVVSFITVSIAIAPTKTALRQQTEFIASASHELRSPLTVIKANLDAAKTIMDPKEHTTLLETAEKETDRLKHLTDDLFILTGSDADAWNMTMTDIYPDTLLIEVYETFHTLCSVRKHTLVPVLPDSELPCVTGDGERIKQMLGIFIHNALDYTPEGTEIELQVNASHGNVTFFVADHGPGIDDNEKKNIFRRFYRSDKSRTDKNHFGLGLAVAAQIAKEHNAILDIVDTPGGGATFKVTMK